MGAFEELYRTYYRQVYFYLLGLCRNEALAEELTQETFFRVLKDIANFRGECRVNVWITQIAKHTFYNYCRRRHLDSEQDLEQIAAGGSMEEKLIDKEQAGEIHKVLHSLKEPYREVFWMRTFGELSLREIGTILGKSDSWARVVYYRAKVLMVVSSFL